jgi:YVTN family beta-propeller protein
VNPVTNEIYVDNQNSNNVTVIDGATNTTTTVGAGTTPSSVAVNPATNKIYVANTGSSNVTVMDEATNTTTTVGAGTTPSSVALNPMTNKIYVANQNSNNVTVIDGATNATQTVPVGSGPNSVAVNPITNKIYVSNENSNNLTVVDGATNTTTTVGAGTTPSSVAVNPMTNAIYVANAGSSSVTVLAEQGVQTIPLTATISPVPGNQTSSATPTFTFTASSSFSPTAPPPGAVYFQVDTWQGAWTPATATTIPGSFTGTLPALSPGMHLVYAYATDGQDATSIQAGGGSAGASSEQSSPVIGNITAYLFLVTAPPTVELESLQVRVRRLHIPQEIRSSLIAKLSNAKASFEAGQTQQVCGLLHAFINEVRAQSGKKIPTVEADELIHAASEIRVTLGCS